MATAALTGSDPTGVRTARVALDLLRSRPATLGAGRLLCLDGPAGSGKSTLAASVAALDPGATVVPMDDLYAGWDGLADVDGQLEGLLRPLAQGRPGRYRRWDWHADDWAGTVEVEPAGLLVVEGVGSGSAATADLVTVLVWLEAAHDVRMQRGLARDGEAFAPHWAAWATAETEHFARHRTRERADLVVRTDLDG